MTSLDTPPRRELSRIAELNSRLTSEARSGRRGSASSTLELLEHIKRTACPTVVTYTSAIDALSKSNDRAGNAAAVATALLSEMQARGLTPNERTYGAAMNAQAKHGSAGRCAALLDEMKRRGLGPTEIQYNALLEAHATRPDGSAAEALRVFDEMRRSATVTLSVVSYTTAVTSQAKKPDGSAATAAALLHEMIESGINPDKVSFTAVIDAQAKRPDGTAEMAEQLLAAMGPFCAPNQIHFNAVLNACANERPAAIDIAERVLGKMLAAGLQPNSFSLSALLRAAAHAEPARPDLARRWFVELATAAELNKHVGSALFRVLPSAEADLLIAKAGGITEPGLAPRGNPGRYRPSPHRVTAPMKLATPPPLPRMSGEWRFATSLPADRAALPPVSRRAARQPWQPTALAPAALPMMAPVPPPARLRSLSPVPPRPAPMPSAGALLGALKSTPAKPSAAAIGSGRPLRSQKSPSSALLRPSFFTADENVHVLG